MKKRKTPYGFSISQTKLNEFKMEEQEDQQNFDDEEYERDAGDRLELYL